jgi:hypothetical protein
METEGPMLCHVEVGMAIHRHGETRTVLSQQRRSRQQQAHEQTPKGCDEGEFRAGPGSLLQSTQDR